MPVLTSRFTDAVAWANEIHGDQLRKGTAVPYISHLLAVSSLVLEAGGDEDQAIAALLHDAVEDTNVTVNEITQRCGEVVSRIVHECSDTEERPKPPWRDRKASYVAHLADASDAALLVSLADKVHNARSILSDYRQEDKALWARFSPQAGGAKGQLWYYGALVTAFDRRLPGHALLVELRLAVSALEELVNQHEPGVIVVD
ncbi:MAG: HD domain-containing protein [Acidimicrobiales bacterium]